MTMEFLSDFVRVYETHIKLRRQKVDCTLYYTDSKMYIEFKDYPFLKVEQNKPNDYLTYTNHTRKVNNLTSEMCVNRILKIIGGKKDEQTQAQAQALSS